MLLSSMCVKIACKLFLSLVFGVDILFLNVYIQHELIRPILSVAVLLCQCAVFGFFFLWLGVLVLFVNIILKGIYLVPPLSRNQVGQSVVMDDNWLRQVVLCFQYLFLKVRRKIRASTHNLLLILNLRLLLHKNLTTLVLFEVGNVARLSSSFI